MGHWFTWWWKKMHCSLLLTVTLTCASDPGPGCGSVLAVTVSTGAILRYRTSACNQVRATQSDSVQSHTDLHQGPCPSSALHATAISLNDPLPTVTAGTELLKWRHVSIPTFYQDTSPARRGSSRWDHMHTSSVNRIMNIMKTEFIIIFIIFINLLIK